MDFQLNREQRMIRETARRIADELVAEKAEEMDRNSEFPSELIERMGRVGLMGMVIPQEYGGTGCDSISYTLAVEEITRASAVTGVIMAVHNSVSAYPLYKFGTEEQRNEYLPRMADGSCIGGFALTEADAGSDVSGVRTKAERDGDEWVLNGSKLFITNGAAAGVNIILARTSNEGGYGDFTTFLVDKGTPGYSYGTLEKKMGITGSDTSELIFEDVRLPDSKRLGRVGEGFKIGMISLDGGRIGIGAQGVGIAQSALDESRKYALEREQFGRPIAKFQAIQWMIAEMATRIEAARMMVLNVAFLKDQGKPFTMESSMAKVFATETAMWCATKAVQVHGGYGYTKDYKVERLMRDAKVTEIYEGTSEVQRIVIAREALKNAR